MEVTSIAEQLLYTTVRIDTRYAGGATGSGTGFVFIRSVGDDQVPVVVTNKHVVEGCAGGSITFTLRDGELPNIGQGYRLEIDGFSDVWTGHPDPAVDVAVMPLAPVEVVLNDRGIRVFYRAIASEIVPSEEQIEKLDAFEQLLFIGYPNGIWDKKNLLPVMRTGTTATPLAVDFEGQPLFLMDASVFPGSSGSPVFLYNPGMYFSKDGSTNLATRLMFVGIVASVYFRDDVNDVVTIPVPTANDRSITVSREMIDLGQVFKARTIVETIDSLIASHGAGL